MIAPHLRTLLLDAADRAFGPGERPPVEVFRERDDTRADFATNWPMRLARPLGQTPDVIARSLAAALPTDPAIALAVPAAGYVNLRLADAWLVDRLATVLEAGAARLRAPEPVYPFKEASERADGKGGPESVEDPTFLVTYTRARLGSLLRLAESEGLPGWRREDGLDLGDPLARELLLRALAIDPREGRTEQTMRLAVELATAFHRFYSARRVFGQPNAIAAQRLSVLQGTFLALNPVMLDNSATHGHG